MSEDTLLSIRDLTKRFGGLVANSNVSFDVAAGSVHAIIGPNGAGKTTLISQLAGDLRPDAGSIHFAGDDITRLSAPARARAGISRIFQISSVMPTLSVRENVALGVIQRVTGGYTSPFRGALQSAVVRDEVDAILQQLNLLHRRETLANALSHGERRQLEMGIAIATRPKMLLLDEPTAGMGREETTAMGQLLLQLRGTHTIVLIEHDMDVVFAVSDKITVMAGGRPIATGRPAEVRQDPAVRLAYLGE
jgi:branched-chain amino acid transport system ATP-binding protein